jgi:ParB/RepB/Spo0J family partition protein
VQQEVGRAADRFYVRYIPREDSYLISSGERRCHVSRAAGLHELPYIEKIADDAETLELALLENLQRKDLTPFEKADGLQRFVDQFDYTHDDIASRRASCRDPCFFSFRASPMKRDVLDESDRSHC